MNFVNWKWYLSDRNQWGSNLWDTHMHINTFCFHRVIWIIFSVVFSYGWYIDPKSLGGVWRWHKNSLGASIFFNLECLKYQFWYKVNTSTFLKYLCLDYKPQIYDTSRRPNSTTKVLDYFWKHDLSTSSTRYFSHRAKF